MSRLVNLSDPIYAELTRIKRAKNQSYSEVVGDLLKAGEKSMKTHGWEEILLRLEAKSRKYTGKREKTDHDLIAHGVSRDDS